jgi:hypothetical protein
MRVDKREFAWVFSELSCPRANEKTSCMKIEEIGQARVCMRVFIGLSTG